MHELISLNKWFLIFGKFETKMKFYVRREISNYFKIINRKKFFLILKFRFLSLLHIKQHL
jgi:hypothetical protein